MLRMLTIFVACDCVICKNMLSKLTDTIVYMFFSIIYW